MFRPTHLLLLLLAGSTAHAEKVVVDIVDEATRYTAWSYACELMPGDCIGLDVPEVVYVVMNYRGLYEGGDTIFISHELPPGVERTSTHVHEMVHYIHNTRGDAMIPGPAEGVCWSENEAFALTDVWLNSQGYPELTRGPYWWLAYWHCEPYYDPEWELWEWLVRGLG